MKYLWEFTVKMSQWAVVEQQIQLWFWLPTIKWAWLSKVSNPKLKHITHSLNECLHVSHSLVQPWMMQTQQWRFGIRPQIIKLLKHLVMNIFHPSLFIASVFQIVLLCHVFFLKFSLTQLNEKIRNWVKWQIQQANEQLFPHLHRSSVRHMYKTIYCAHCCWSMSRPPSPLFLQWC